MTPQELIAYIEGLIIDNTTQQVTPYKNANRINRDSKFVKSV